MTINLNTNILTFNKQNKPLKTVNQNSLYNIKLLKNDSVSFSANKNINAAEKEYQANILKVANALKNAKNVAILTHKSPDGDAISSSAAALNLIKRLPNIENVSAFISGETPSQYSFLEDTKDFINIKNKSDTKKYLGKFDTVITVDCPSTNQLGDSTDILNSAKTILKVDHHPSRENYADIEAVNDKAASATEVLLDLTKALNVKIENEPMLAKDLYTGLMTDTGGLKFMKDPQHTFMTCAEISKSGIDVEAIHRKAIEFMPKAVIPIYKKIVNSLTFSPDGKIAYITADAKDPDFRADASSSKNVFKSLISQFLSIEGVEVGASLTKCYENENSKDKLTSISLRSNRIKISDIAEANNGGGHDKAAGCAMNKSVEDTMKSLTKTITGKIKAEEAKKSNA
ncbi:MAG: DHH family phosphoesterase [bacterium]